MIRSAETGPISQPALLRRRERTPMVPTHAAGRKTLPTAGKTSQAPAAWERLSLPPLHAQGQRKAPRRELPSPSAMASRRPDPAAHGFMLCLAPAPENPLLKVLRILSKKNPSPGPGMQGALCQGCSPPRPPGTGDHAQRLCRSGAGTRRHPDQRAAACARHTGR